MTRTRPKPRTQAERRAETRAALLDATIESLVEYGYAGTTTGRIAELAGVSRGAQTPYFRSRAELLGAAVQHLAERRIEDFDQRIAGKSVSLEVGLDVIWEEHQGPLFDAALELWVAARTDPELRRGLVEMERNVASAIAKEAVTALGEIAKRPGFTDDLIFAMATIRGLALLRISDGASSRSLAERWSKARERLIRVLS
ncbi:MAG: TetR family transcriptional regulator [Solirubrobacterales bacterium]|nr:TetR family transcriptional regulator [Solirubrobacterales bacterium]